MRLSARQASMSNDFDPRRIRPLRSKLLVRQYTKPERVKSIIIPIAARADETLSLWELDRYGADCEEIVGQSLVPGDLIQTNAFGGVYAGSCETADAEGVPYLADYFFIDARQVRSVVRY